MKNIHKQDINAVYTSRSLSKMIIAVNYVYKITKWIYFIICVTALTCHSFRHRDRHDRPESPSRDAERPPGGELTDQSVDVDATQLTLSGLFSQLGTWPGIHHYLILLTL